MICCKVNEIEEKTTDHRPQTTEEGGRRPQTTDDGPQRRRKRDHRPQTTDHEIQ